MAVISAETPGAAPPASSMLVDQKLERQQAAPAVALDPELETLVLD
jgi:hypothetical protein